MVGVVLSILGLSGVVIALIEGVHLGWSSGLVIAAGVVGVLSTAAFFVAERRRRTPLFDVRVLSQRRVAVGASAIVAMYGSFLGLLFLLPQYLQYVQDRSAPLAGLVLLPLGVALGVAAPYSARLLAAVGTRWTLTGGMLIMAASAAALLSLGAMSPLAVVSLATAVFGAAFGLTMVPATAVIMNDLPLAKAGDGAAVNQLARQIGGALGVAIVGSVFAAVYAAGIAAALPAVPSGSSEVAQSSIEGAARVAAQVGGDLGTQVLVAADQSFDSAARAGIAVCVGMLVLAAGGAFGALRRASPVPQPTPLGSAAPGPAEV
jgi:predicted MFS family arabinose efflux permease